MRVKFEKLSVRNYDNSKYHYIQTSWPMKICNTGGEHGWGWGVYLRATECIYMIYIWFKNKRKRRYDGICMQ